MSAAGNPQLLPMRGYTPVECPYDVLAVRWWWWTDPVPRGPVNARGTSIVNDPAALELFRTARRRMQEFGIAAGTADALELAMAMACGDEP